MKRYLCLGLLLVMAVCGAGCSTIQKKFTRKPKEGYKASTVYIEEKGPYQKQFSNEYYYKTHYTFWTSWHGELLDNLDGNQKKMLRAAQEAWNHLTEINRYLKPEKQAQLEPIKNDFEKIYRKIEKGSFRPSDKPMFRSDLEKIGRQIANDFYFDKVKDSLVTDTVDLGQ